MIAGPMGIVTSAILLLFLSVLLASLLKSHQRLVINVSFVTASAASLLGIAGGVWAVGGGFTNKLILPLGLPDLPFHVRIDPLAGFFITVICLLSFFVSVYSIGYI